MNNFSLLSPVASDAEIFDYCGVVMEDLVNLCVERFNSDLMGLILLFSLLFFILGFLIGVRWKKLRIEQ